MTGFGTDAITSAEDKSHYRSSACVFAQMDGQDALPWMAASVERLCSLGLHETAASLCLHLLRRLGNSAIAYDVACAYGQLSYLLAVQLAQLGRSSMADQIFRLLGCTVRLSDAILNFTAQTCVAREPSSAQSSACMLSSALPDRLFLAVQQGLSAASRFWTETQYHSPDSRFASYLYKLDARPCNAVEAAILHLQAALRSASCPWSMDGVVAAEWWAHIRQPQDAHQLHFDLDESKVGAGSEHYDLVHPVLSSVLYLADCGGPTLVLEQSAGSALAQRGCLVTPRCNALLCFPGQCLHGVLPGLQVVRVEGQDDPQHRISLMVAWWGHELQAQPGAPGSGPARVLRTATALLPMSNGNRAARGATLQAQWSSLQAIAPAWVSISRDACQLSEGGAASALPLPCLRFALRSAEDIKEVYLPGTLA